MTLWLRQFPQQEENDSIKNLRNGLFDYDGKTLSPPSTANDQN